ncbi:MAG: alpha/beta hydrolase [Burkholderiaceae bacterium]|nr:alpha/beta hydrolase [Burkholderiaceae bacterium]
MPPIVLVHGAWAGAWCWKRVLAPLRAAGHEVHAVTLTGLGERSHLLSPAVTLATHVADVVGLIAAEELEGVVLVGHSYGGLVITGAADRLQRDAPGALRQLAAFGLHGADRDWLLRRQTPQPFAVYREPLPFDAARIAALPRAFVDCTRPPLPTIDVSRRRVREQPGWQVVEMSSR